MTQIKRKDEYRYVAYDAANGAYDEFKTLEEAKIWLKEDDGDGISEDACYGKNWIAEKQYYSVVTKTEDRDDYCTCGFEFDNNEDECPNCKKEKWEYSEDFEWIGYHDYERIKWSDKAEQEAESDTRKAEREKAVRAFLKNCPFLHNDDWCGSAPNVCSREECEYLQNFKAALEADN